MTLLDHLAHWLSKTPAPSTATALRGRQSPSLLANAAPKALDGEDDTIQQAIQQGQLSHIAMIMDGNRRWAKRRSLPAEAGHWEGVEALRRCVRYCSRLGLPYLTVYAFSTENWRRSTSEVSLLMRLIEHTLKAQLEEFAREHVRIRFLGRRDRIPESLQAICHHAETSTAHHDGITLQIALDYGGRDEVLQAIQRLIPDIQAGRVTCEDFETAETFARHLTTFGTPDPDLLIRTSGENRLSNFLLWQTAYTELFFTERLWPEMSAETVREAILEFLARQRRYGQ
jgi:undecaprenyl diphosphate synthase